MAKQSKRSRKFQASGGVAARLKRGTVTKHGKLKRRHKGTAPQDNTRPSHNDDLATNKQTKDRSDDLTSNNNLGNLNVDDFFAQMADHLEQDMVESMPDHQEKVDPRKHRKEDSNSSSSDDDDDDDDNNDDDGNNDSPENPKDNPLPIQRRRAEDASSDSESSEDEDDHDIEAAEARMKQEMARLTETDPEFHNFLRDNEQSLLEFGQDDNEDAHEDMEDEDMDRHDENDKQHVKDAELSSHEPVLTISVLDKLRRGAFESRGIKALKKLVNAYRSGCHLADSADKKRLGQSYLIESSEVFDSLMLLCLSQCHDVFHWHLLGLVNETKENTNEEATDEGQDPDNKPIPPHKLENAEKWTAIKPILQVFFRATNHLLNESKEARLLSFVLKALAKYVPLMSPFPAIADLLLKTCTSVWSAPFDSTANFQVVRLQAFFRIRQLAITQPFPFVETCLKRTYLAYSQRAAFGTASSLATTLPTLTFMGNCLVELYSLDYQSSYQHAFVYIRELALQLRAAMQKKSPEAIQRVYGWQYMHSLKLWTALLADAMAKEDNEPDAKLMRSLLYPLVEIILGTARNAPSPVRLLPLRLQCIRLLQQLAASAQVYLPTTSLLLDCFDWKEWYAKPKKSTKRNTLRGGLPLYMLIKLPKEDPLRTQEQLDASLVQLFTLLEREMELYRYTAAFPEFRVRIRQRCRDFSKVVSSSRWKAYAKGCMDKSDQLAAFCTLERAKLAMAPKDVMQLECLRPSQIPTMRERHQKSLDQESKLAQSALETAAAAAAAAGSPGLARNDNMDDPNDDQNSVDKEGMVSHEDGAGRSRPPAEKRRSEEKVKKKRRNLPSPNEDRAMVEEDEVMDGADWLQD